MAPVHDWLSDATAALAQEQQHDNWSDIRQTRPAAPAAEPWARGYALARATRARIGVNGGPIDFAELGPLEIPQRDTNPPSARIHGLVGRDTPACMTAPRGPIGTRFLIARALGEYLSRSAPGPSLLSSLATDRQALSPAFAAEFLAPAESLRQRIAGEHGHVEETDDLAYEFRVSSELIRRQIQNHDVAKDRGLLRHAACPCSRGALTRRDGALATRLLRARDLQLADGSSCGH